MCIPTNIFYSRYSQSWYDIIFAMDRVDLKMSYNVSLPLLRKYNDILIKKNYLEMSLQGL